MTSRVTPTPEFWDEQGFRGGVLLPVDEINLRYVAITRAETTCSSGLWPAPMFSGLADYVRPPPARLRPLPQNPHSRPCSMSQRWSLSVSIGPPCFIVTRLPCAGSRGRWMWKLWSGAIRCGRLERL